MKSGDTIRLRGKTLKGKNRIQEHGEEWLIRSVDRSVLSRNLGYLVCPASYVGTGCLNPKYDTARSIHQVNGYCRWIRKSNDPDFEILDQGAS